MPNINYILTIAKKEFRANFLSPVAYIVIVIFLLFIGGIFFSRFFLSKVAELRDFFNLLPFFLAAIVPAITMRLYSEELNTGSYELLATLPVTNLEITLGKLLSAFYFVGLLLAPTLFYAFTVELVGDLEWGPAIGGYLGALLLGFSFAAIGLFTSSLTKNQIIAWLSGALICYFLTMIDVFLIFLWDFLVDFLRHISIRYHFENIAKGVVDFRDILYFFTLVYVFVHSTIVVMDRKTL